VGCSFRKEENLIKSKPRKTMKYYNLYRRFARVIALFIFLCAVQNSAAQVPRLDELGKPIPKNASAKAKFAEGEALVKFKEDVLDYRSLETNASRFSILSGSIKAAPVEQALRKAGVTGMRRAVLNARPSQKTSISRSGETVSVPSFHNLMVIEVPRNTDILKLCEEISKMSEVEYAEPNHIYEHNDSPPNDPFYFLQRGFEQPNDIDIDANRAWDFSTGNSSIRVGVIDNGVDYHNPDLGGGFGNGFKVAGGYDYFNGDNDPDDDNVSSHGTACAGIIGGLRNNAIGIAGLGGGNGSGNIGVSIYAFKAGGSGMFLNTDNIISAIYDASSSSGFACHILNNSYGSSSYNESMRSAVRFAAQNGVIFVASKGNNGVTTPFYPSDYDGSWVISVGASGSRDRRASLDNGDEYNSNYGNGIDVAAPGVLALVYTTKRNEQGSYGQFNGTSAAAPHVAGLAALLRSVNPTLHPEDVQGIIRASADKVGLENNFYVYDAKGYNENVGFGRINAGRAMEMVSGVGGVTLAHYTASNGASVGNTGTQVTAFINPGGGLASGTYIVKRYDVRKTVSFPPSIASYVWGRGVGATNGWSAANPNQQVGFCNVVSNTNSSAELQSFVYEIWTINGDYLGWYPCQPHQVNFAYTVLGVPVLSPVIAAMNQFSDPFDNRSIGATCSVYPTLSQGNGELTYSWEVVCNSGHFAVSGLNNSILNVQSVNWSPSNVTGDCSAPLANRDVRNLDAPNLRVPQARLRVRCTIINAAGFTISSVYELRLGVASGGCPYVFTKTDEGFQQDNNILHRSEFEENIGVDITDRYKLRLTPALQNNEYKFFITETDSDHSYLDRFRLFAIDHPAQTELGVTEANQIVMFNATSVVSSPDAWLNWENVTDYIRYDSLPKGANGVPQDVLKMQFENTATKSAQLARGKDIDGLEIESSDNAVITTLAAGIVGSIEDPPAKRPAGTIETSGGGRENTAQPFARREMESLIIIPVQVGNATDSVRVNWARDFKMGYMAVTPILYSGFTQRNLNLGTAQHTRLGDVRAKLVSQNQQYAEMVKGDTIFLSFQNRAAVASGMKRSFVLETRGRYLTPRTLERGARQNQNPNDRQSNSLNTNSPTGILPKEYALSQNYPNPFNPVTVIRYELPEASAVKLQVFDMLGRVVATVVNERREAGIYEAVFNASGLSSGTYFYRLQAGTFVETKKMMLVK
jgi:subtilisin family serine protease